MSNTITNLDKIREYHRPNCVEYVRIFGQIVEFDPMNLCIIIRSIGSITRSSTTIKLLMDENLILTDPQLAHSGTVVSVYGLYNGSTVRMIHIDVVDIDLTEEDMYFLQEIPKCKKDPL